jgi:hypothetical protein
MPAAATARTARSAAPVARPATRRAPPRPRTASSRRATARRRSVPRGARLVPVAVGRTAVAVGGFADSGIFVRLTRGRLWIGLLAALLVGIVALNVLALSFSASSSKTAAQAEDLAQQNSALRAQLATALSDERVQAEASELGLVVPDPGAIRYREPEADDAAQAARRLRDGELSDPGYVPPPVTSEPAAAPVTDTATAPVPATDPTVTDPAVDPVAAVDPATTDATVAPTEPVTDATTTDTAVAPTGGVSP